MDFIAGEVLDVERLNKLASFPRVATFRLPHNSGATSGMKSLSIDQLEDRDGIGITQLSATVLELPAGEYLFDIPIKF